MSDESEQMNVRQTARRLGVHENTIRNWEKRGILVAVRLPGSSFRRFNREDIERMRAEMFSQFAPAVELPDEPDKDARGHILTDGDWA